MIPVQYLILHGYYQIFVLVPHLHTMMAKDRSARTAGIGVPLAANIIIIVNLALAFKMQTIQEF